MVSYLPDFAISNAHEFNFIDPTNDCPRGATFLYFSINC